MLLYICELFSVCAGLLLSGGPAAGPAGGAASVVRNLWAILCVCRSAAIWRPCSRTCWWCCPRVQARLSSPACCSRRCASSTPTGTPMQLPHKKNYFLTRNRYLDIFLFLFKGILAIREIPTGPDPQRFPYWRFFFWWIRPRNKTGLIILKDRTLERYGNILKHQKSRLISFCL